MKEPTNTLLLEKILNLKEDTSDISEHLARLNGSVAKNSKFIVKAMVYFKIIGFIMSVVIVPLIVLYIKKQIGL